MPWKPYIVPGRPNIRVIIPFAPNKSTKPIPWDIDGISMGRVTKTEKTSRCGKLLRTTQMAKSHAIIMEITVAIPAALIELTRDSLKRGSRKTPVMSDAVMLKSIAAKGQITVINKKIPIIIFSRFEPAEVFIWVPLEPALFLAGKSLRPLHYQTGR
jgi:hypothetical protein